MNVLQGRILDILKWTDEVCRKNNIRYYLMGGSMLGAVRHKGFIPWDDDIDIAVPREDYEQLYKLLINTEHKKYCVETHKNGNADYIYPYMKIYDKTTTVVENTTNRLVRGVFLDVFPIDGMGSCNVEEMKHFKKIRLHVNLLSVKVCCWSKDRKLYKNLAIIAARFLPLGKEYNRLLRKIDEISKEISYDTSEFVGVLSGTYGEKELMPKSYYGKPTEYDFEGIKVLGVEQYDKYLTKLYGNYMQLPPVEKQVSPHSFIRCELNVPYRK